MTQDKKHIAREMIVEVGGLDQLCDYELFFELAHGYLHAACAVFQQQRESGKPYYFNLLPGMFSIVHGIECYLKAAILLGDHTRTVNVLSEGSMGHNLGRLYDEYRRIYPGPEFRLPVRAEDYIEWSSTAPRTAGGIFERYLLNKNGRLLNEKGRDILLLDSTLDVIHEIGLVFDRAEVEMRQRAGKVPKTHLEHMKVCTQK